MALFSEVRGKPTKREIALALVGQRVLQIPEALVLGLRPGCRWPDGDRFPG